MNIDLTALSLDELKELDNQIYKERLSRRQSEAKEYLDKLAKCLDEIKEHNIECIYFNDGWATYIDSGSCYVNSDNDIVLCGNGC